MDYQKWKDWRNVQTKKKRNRRIPKGYDGTKVTTRKFGDVLSSVLSQIHQSHEQRSDLILASWPHLVGPRIAEQTQPESFVEGILLVKVNNSTLYSLLTQNDKPMILKTLRKKFPKVEIKNIRFQIG